MATLLDDPATEPIGSEIGGASGLCFLFDEESTGKVLQAIYGDDGLSLWKPPPQSAKRPDATVRYVVTIGWASVAVDFLSANFCLEKGCLILTTKSPSLSWYLSHRRTPHQHPRNSNSCRDTLEPSESLQRSLAPSCVPSSQQRTESNGRPKPCASSMD